MAEKITGESSVLTLDFWEEEVIYEGQAFPAGTLSCHALNKWDLAANLEGGAYVREADDGTWCFEWEMTYIAPTPAMPAEALLVFETESGFRTELPVTLK